MDASVESYEKRVDTFEKGVKWVLGCDSNLQFWVDSYANYESLHNLR